MNFGVENKWEESDEEINEDEVMNEVPPPDIDEQFRKNVLTVKHNLYDSTVLKPKLGTPQAQSGEVIEDYFKKLNNVYILCLNAQKGIVDPSKLNRFPQNVKEPLLLVLNWLSDFFTKNRVADTIPYKDYIRKNFKEFQFVQDNSFE
jgi:hypothetical protein